MAFEAVRDIRIDAMPSLDGRGFVLRTSGLARHGRPELELDGVPEAGAKHAAVVLNQIANYVVNQSPVQDGETLAIRHSSGALIVRLVAGPEMPAKGVFGRLFGKSVRLQRVVEPVEGMDHPKTMLSTVALWRAASLLAEDSVGEARAALLESVRQFPGVPGQRGELFMGFPFNWQNHLAYAMLGALANDPRERERCFADAFARSEEYELSVIGDSAPSLRALERKTLISIARRIAAENARAVDEVREEVSPSVVMRVSPLRMRVETEGGLLAERRLTILPLLCANYLAAPTSDVAFELVADVLIAYAGRPGKLALLTEDVRQLYEGGNDEAPVYGQPSPYQTGDRIVSALLADVVRRAYAGLDSAELRASYDLVDDAALRASADAKMNELGAREAEGYVQAMQLEM